MNAKELQEQAQNIKLDYEDPEDKMQLLILQTWANIAVSLEHLVEYTYSIDKSLGSIKDMMQREHQVWFDRMEKGFIHAEGSDDLDPLPEDDPFRLG